MATIGNSFLGIIDHYKRVDRNGNIMPIIEALHQLNPLMQDAHVIEANNGSSHRSTIRTGLGSVAWGKLYQGILQSKSTTQQVEDTTGFVERLSTIDTRFLKLVKDPAGERMAEANAALEAISQDVQSNFFYADSNITPERFKGLAARYNAISGGGAAAAQIVDGGGTGSDNTSVWLVGWGAPGTSLIYPEGTTGGIQREDKGEQRTLDDNSMPYFVKEEYFSQHVGVKVGDWRYNVRIANIDVSDLIAGTVNLLPLLRKAYHRIQGRTRATNMNNENAASEGRTVIYMNRTAYEALDANLTSPTLNAALRLTPMQLEGEEVEAYRGIPIRVTDALLNTEARVV
jgi:hypothetical protein